MKSQNNPRLRCSGMERSLCGRPDGDPEIKVCPEATWNNGNLQLCQFQALAYLTLRKLLSEKELYWNSGQNRRRIYGGLTFFHLLTFQIGEPAQQTELRGGGYLKPLKFFFANRAEFIWTLSLQSKSLISNQFSLCIPCSLWSNRGHSVRKRIWWGWGPSSPLEY